MVNGFFETMILPYALSYLINLASNERSAVYAKGRDDALQRMLSDEATLTAALDAQRSTKETINAACADFIRNRSEIGDVPEQEYLWKLISDPLFQGNLTSWLMAGSIEESDSIQNQLHEAIIESLIRGGMTTSKAIAASELFFDAIDRSILGHPSLGHWRHQQSLYFISQQMALTVHRVQEAAGHYSEELKKRALDKYCEKSLASWDIIDLSNLPEGDIQMATQKLLLRQLYMPLRILPQVQSRSERDNVTQDRRSTWDEISGIDLDEDSSTDTEPDDITDLMDTLDFFSSDSDGTYAHDTVETNATLSVGDFLKTSQRIVVLGDPGGGKTTMLRWLATAFLLRCMNDAAFTGLPDTESLPDESWIPVLFRCRDLGPEDLCGSFRDFLAQHLNKSELLPEDADVMHAVILDHLSKGQAIILIDGLDEITDIRVRMMLCQELERTAARYPAAPIIATSRIVGYRDMPYRMQTGFEHGVIAELTLDDKDLFAERWIAVTEHEHTRAEREKRVRELKEALHATNRIERLTGNPMLLTTLALVKRKVGKLPNRRTKLYREAVAVLLNWNPRHYAVIEEEEAHPQLEYIAFEMCRRGVQRLGACDILDLLDRVRQEYPHIRAIRRRDPEEFLKLLEERSSILIRSGADWLAHNVGEPIWEFRHLTFQEYLAARALIDGRYPDRVKGQPISVKVAELAGQVEETDHWNFENAPELEVARSWQEALRLLIADCRDDDVDDALLAILNPIEGEVFDRTKRPRAILAGRCLTDEPNVSEGVSQVIIERLLTGITEQNWSELEPTPLASTVLAIGSCNSSQSLRTHLFQRYLIASPSIRTTLGCLWSEVESRLALQSEMDFPTYFDSLVNQLQSEDQFQRIASTLAIMQFAYEGRAVPTGNLKENLIHNLEFDAPEQFACLWALGWLVDSPDVSTSRGTPVWSPTVADAEKLATILGVLSWEEEDSLRWLLTCLDPIPYVAALSSCMGLLKHPNARIRQKAIQYISKLGSKDAVPALIEMLQVPDNEADAIQALGVIGDDRAVPHLLEIFKRRSLKDPNRLVDALVQLGDANTIHGLIKHAGSKSEQTQLAVVTALMKIGGQLGVDALRIFLAFPNENVSAHAAYALMGLKDSQNETSFKSMLASESIQVRKAAVRAYANLSRSHDARLVYERLGGPKIQILDPREPVTEKMLEQRMRMYGMTKAEVMSGFAALENALGLTLSWST